VINSDKRAGYAMLHKYIAHIAQVEFLLSQWVTVTVFLGHLSTSLPKATFFELHFSVADCMGLTLPTVR